MTDTNDKPRPLKSETGLPDEPRRVKAFANFFKSYMSISSVVAAALPIPVTMIELIPVYKAHSTILSTYTPMLCFLILGYLFFQRHILARSFFGVTVMRQMLAIEEKDREFDWESRLVERENDQGKIWEEQKSWKDHKYLEIRRARRRSKYFSVVPFLLIIATVLCLFGYQLVLDQSLDIAAKGEFEVWQTYRQDTSSPSPLDTPYVSNLLHNSPLPGIPHSTTLLLLYMGIFLFAEAAFILMAIKEYLQDLLGIDDVEEIIESNPYWNKEKHDA